MQDEKDAHPEDDMSKNKAAEQQTPETDANEIGVNEAETNGVETDNAETSEADAAEAETAEQKIADLNDNLLRTLAELENTRKRAERDRSEALKFGAMRFARDMLGVVDNLQRALKAFADNGDELPENTAALVEGVAATQRDLLAALARHKVTPLNPMGEKFDPNLHEALFEAPGTGQENGTIIEVVETGYMMEERLLRPAKVGIAKNE